jgi:hypothetical protein
MVSRESGIRRSTLWRRRQAEGMRQKDIVAFLGRKPAWVSRNSGAPGNWTLRTFGEFMQALGGEAEIQVRAVEDAAGGVQNHYACDGMLPQQARRPAHNPTPAGGSWHLRANRQSFLMSN